MSRTEPKPMRFTKVCPHGGLNHVWVDGPKPKTLRCQECHAVVALTVLKAPFHDVPLGAE